MDFHIFIHIFTNFHRCLHILPHNQRIHTLIALLIYKLSCKQTSSLNKTENTSSLVLARNSFPRLNYTYFRFLSRSDIILDLVRGGRWLRPISLLTLSLLTLLESNFPGKSLGNPYGPGNSNP